MISTSTAILVAILMHFSLGADSASERIAFVSSTEQEDQCVTILDLTDTSTKRVGRGQLDGAPTWSRDGRWLAFESKNEGLAVFIVAEDGSGLTQISKRESWNRSPQWSPNGRALCYAGGDGFSSKAIVYDIEARSEKVWGGGKTGILCPVWLDDDTLLAAVVFESEGKLTTELNRITVDGVAPFSKTMEQQSGNYVEYAPSVSLSRDVIAYESNDGGDREVFVSWSDARFVDVSNHRAADWNPQCSPDGSWVLFESFRSGRRGVYRVFAATGRVLPVVNDTDANNWASSYSPDGQRIVFVSDRTGDAELYRCDVTGENVVRLTERPGPDLAPVWRPKGKS